MFGLPAFWDTQGALLHSVRTGRVTAASYQLRQRVIN